MDLNYNTVAIMNLSSKMICPSCGKEMGNGGCTLGPTVSYKRTCTCGMQVLCVPMQKGYRYTVSLSNDEIEEERRLAKQKVDECEKALDEARRTLEHIS